jgi:hypothetical protein
MRIHNTAFKYHYTTADILFQQVSNGLPYGNSYDKTVLSFNLSILTNHAKSFWGGLIFAVQSQNSADLCCGSGSTCFWATWIRIRIHYSDVWIRIRILLSPSKNSKKKLASYCFVTSFWLFIFENYRNGPKKVKSKKILLLVFVSILKVNDENSSIRIRIRIHTKMSWIHNTGADSTKIWLKVFRLVSVFGLFFHVEIKTIKGSFLSLLECSGFLSYGSKDLVDLTWKRIKKC